MSAPGTDEVRLALEGAARHGPFFTLRELEPADASAGFAPISLLYGPGGEDVLREAARAVAAAVGAGSGPRVPRTAVSLLHLSAAATVCSPVLAAASTAGVVPALDPAELRFRYLRNGRLELRLARITAARPARDGGAGDGGAGDGGAGDGGGGHGGGGDGGATAALARLVYREAVERHLVPLGEALCRVVPLSRHIRRGNVASALAAAAAMLGASDPAGRAGTDPVGGRARAILRALLEDGPLRTAGTLEPAGPGAPPFFLRHNCCLYYRIPGGGTCGDCVLAAPPGSRDASRRARPRDAHA